ncbi:hypothetical protein V9T40_011908 [Parthenolecanium corni]|uniref:Uncharacterized protein n=1 Tax=Parthenolecanium corni TaxID=536013 RepID=A0AAN9TJJ2_9HEMI
MRGLHVVHVEKVVCNSQWAIPSASGDCFYTPQPDNVTSTRCLGPDERFVRFVSFVQPPVVRYSHGQCTSSAANTGALQSAERESNETAERTRVVFCPSEIRFSAPSTLAAE